MPAIHLFHRKTYLGGDDLQPSSLLTIFVRFLQLFGLILPLFIHILLTSSNCNNNHIFPLLLCVYTIASLCYCFCSIYMETKIIKTASIGTPTQPELRVPAIQTLLEWRIACFVVLNLAVVVLGGVCLGYAKSYYNEEYLCDDEENGLISRAWLAAPILLFLSQLAELLISIIGLIQLLCSSDKRGEIQQQQQQQDVMISSQHANHPLLQIPHTSSFEITSTTSPSTRSTTLSPYQQQQHSHSHHTHAHPHHELVEEMWSSRMKYTCKCLSLSTCYFFGGREIEHGDYGDISRVLADYFEHNGVLDLVPSDLMVGFGMLHRIQRQRILEARKGVLEEKNCLERGVYVGGGVVCDEGLLGTSATGADVGGARAPSPVNSTRSTSGGGRGLMKEDSASMIMTISRVDDDDDDDDESEVDTESFRTADEHSTATTRFNGLHHDDALSFRMTTSPRTPSNTSHTTHNSPLDTTHNNSENESSEVWYEPNRRQLLTKTNVFDIHTMEEGARYSRFALAIYTWVLYVYMNPMSGLCKLGFVRGKHFVRRLMNKSSCANDGTDGTSASSSSPVVGDNCCGAHHAGLLSLLSDTSISPSDIRYIQLKSGFTETPYCIIIDHKWSSVVLSIRGTLSLEDCVVDVLCDPAALDGLGREFGFDAEGQYCHAGVLDCTRWVYDDLQRHNILEQILTTEFPNYKLRIVGHSLGAGCAVLLSYMMKRTYPTLRCTSISPPGMFITWKLATECRDFVTSFVLDSDFIPRLSVENMEHLRNEVLELIGRIKVPKIEVVRTLFTDSASGENGDGCGTILCCCCGETHHDDVEYYAQVNENMLYPRDSIPQDTEFARQLEQFKSIQSERKRHRGGLREVVLFPPGRIVHLVKTGQRKSCLHGLGKCITCGMTNAGSEYTPIWAENDDFNEVLVSPTMWTDHFPNRVCLEIEKVATDAFGLDLGGGGADAGTSQQGSRCSSGMVEDK